jgi:hypothetical protein
MDSAISMIGGFVLSLALGFLPVELLLVLFALLNRRDRRQARLLSLAVRPFSGEVLRSDLVITARCAVLTGAAVVQVDIRHDGGAVWPALERLRQGLPPRVRLVVIGAPRPDPSGDPLRDGGASEPRAALAVAGLSPTGKRA